MVFVSLFQIRFSANLIFTKSSTLARGDCPSHAGAKSSTSGNSKGKL
jgi:hypothetical protein